MTELAPGDDVYMGSILCNVHIWGIVSDIDTPSGMVGTFEILGNDGAITMDALRGPKGDKGDNAPIVKMQYTSPIDDPEDLPQNLTDSEVDIGKAWWVGNQVYLWTGAAFVQKAMGTQGAVGPPPDIDVSVQLIDPDGPDPSEVVKGGTLSNPTLLFKLKVPEGPAGPAGPIREAEDYDDSVEPETNDVISWNGEKYAPAAINFPVSQIYSVPEGAFQNFTGISDQRQVAAFAVPQQTFEWTPLVWGHIRAIGIEADSDPLILGCEVRLGDPIAGTVVGRGFGNISTYANIVPHYSTAQAPNEAITPLNGHAVVPAGHTGTTGTLYVNLFNDGLLGAYSFNKKGAQLFVMVQPVGELTIWPDGS